MEQLSWKFTPSIIETYFARGNCLRGLVTGGLQDEDREKFGFAQAKRSESSVAKSGDLWEKSALDLLRKKHGEDCIIQSQNKNNDKLCEDAAVSEIRKLNKDTSFPKYLYQLELRISKGFLKRNITNISSDEWNSLLDGDEKIRIDNSKSSYPDLIRIDWSDKEQKLVMSVVDIKLAKKPKTEHKMQIALYIRLLEDFILRNRLTDICEVDTAKGYLFNFGQTEEKEFPTDKVFNFLDNALNLIVSDMANTVRNSKDLSKVAYDFPYHISQKCEWCPNYERCIEHCVDSGEEVMLLPYLSPYSQDYLRSVTDSYSCDSIKSLCEAEDGKEKLKENKFFKRFLRDYENALNILSDKCNSIEAKPAKRQVATTEMPASEDIQVVLTAQKDEYFDSCYLWSLKITSENYSFNEPSVTNSDDAIDVRFNRSVSSLLCTVIVRDMEKQREAADVFVQIWHNLLSQVNEYNKRQELIFEKPLSLQHFVMDNYELKNLIDTLFSTLESSEADTCSKAMDILMVLQGKELVESESAERPEGCANYPITIITTVINKLFIIPAFISLSIVDICNGFASNLDETESEIFKKISNDLYLNKKSNVFRNDVINNYWTENNSDLLNDIFNYVENRLNAEHILLKKVREFGHGGIRFSPEPFKFSDSAEYYIPEISKLRFETKYELQLSYIESQRIRSNLMESITDNKIWHLKLDKCCESENENYFDLSFKILNTDGFNKDSFFSVVICKKSNRNIRALPFYRDDWSIEENNNYLRTISPGSRFFYFKFPRLNDNILTISIKRGELDSILENEEYYMFEPIENFNSPKNLMAFRNADKSDRDYIVFPINNLHKITDCSFEKSKETLKGYGRIGNENFTSSQENALKHFYENNITLLQGPPGTGKTDFIARSVISVSRLYKEKGKGLKILVSANSHAAIDNVLVKVCEMLQRMPPIDYDFTIAKFDRLERSTNGIKVVTPKKASKKFKEKFLSDDSSMIIGSTLWAIPKFFNEENNPGVSAKDFDIIILDEASQVRMADAVIPFLHSSKENTRFLIVGDENQLPPIIAGKYEKDPEKPFLFGSVFRYYYDCDRLNNSGDSYVVSLKENFRSNSAIFDYSAKKIYGSGENGYHSFNQDIGSQTLSDESELGDRSILECINKCYPNDSDNEMYASIIDPEYPLVLCNLKNMSAVDSKEKEIKMVTKLTKIFENLYENSSDFWESKFGIVSPHHEHIQRLKNSIANESEDKNDLFIGTVDKLQGQERQTVIVSYGVSDIEQALTEGEFIFSRNRLNVAITRAKKKCIVFLSDAVLNYPMEALAYNDQELLDGIDYVCGFGKYMENFNKSEYSTDNITILRKGNE